MGPDHFAARLDAVTVRVDAHTLLDRVTFSVSPRGITALLGPNGAGKSTLLSVLLGLREPDDGSVRLFEDGVAPRDAPRGSLSAVLQDEGAFEGMTAHEYAALFAALFSDRAMTERVLEDCALTERRHTRVDRLSGGELRRLQLAVALATDPALLVLDEPTNHLDPAARRALLERLRAQRTRRAVLFATHDLHEAARVADAVIILVGGTVRADGPVDDLVRALPAPFAHRGIEGLFEHATRSTIDPSGALDELSDGAAQ